MLLAITTLRGLGALSGTDLAIAGLVGSGVDENRDPPEETVVQVVTETHVIDEGVVVDGGLADADSIGRVEGQRLLVGGVGFDCLGLQDEGLVEEELADV